MNKHHKCSCQTTNTGIVPGIFIISYLYPISKSEKQCFLNKIQGVIIDIIGPTRDLVEIHNDDWRHLEPSAIGDLIKSISGHTILAYPDLFLTIDDPPSVPIDSPSCTSNNIFDFCNINANNFPLDPPNDPYFMKKKQWYLTSTNVDLVWKENLLTGSNITVAVIDSGADKNHDDLQTTFLPGYNVANDSNNTSDSDGHGTEISGIIAATTNNGIGMASVAPHAKVRPIKNRSATHPPTLAYNLKGLIYILQELDKDPDYAQIINLSQKNNLIPNTDTIDDFLDILDKLNNYNVLVVIAAGNDGDEGNQIGFPAYLGSYNLPNVVTVGGINEEYEPVPSSTHGSNYVQVAAPGIDILTTDISTYYIFTNNYAKVEGTSFAAPIVCGILALMYQMIKNIPMKIGTKTLYLRNKLFESTVRTKETEPRGNYWKYGVVDASAAVRAIKADPPRPII